MTRALLLFLLLLAATGCAPQLRLQKDHGYALAMCADGSLCRKEYTAIYVCEKGKECYEIFKREGR